MLTRIRELEEAQLSIEKERLHAAEELAEARMQLEIAQAERTTQTTRDLSGDSEEVQEDGDADPEAQDQIGPLEGPTDAPKQDMQRQRKCCVCCLLQIAGWCPQRVRHRPVSATCFVSSQGQGCLALVLLVV